jgi:hypothetical protein
MQKLDSLTSPEYFGWQILIKMSFFFVLVSVLFASEVEAEVLNSNFSTQRSHWDLLVARDEHFAGRASEVGRTQAFLEFLAPDSIVFREGPTGAIERYSDDAYAAEREAELNWKAHYVDVSRDGDLGLSAGPMIIYSESGQDSFNHLISIWKNSDTRWELMADIVVPIPGFLSLEVSPNWSDTLPLFEETIDPSLVLNDLTTEEGLRAADDRFGQSINFRGGQRALLRYGLENTRVYLPGMGPAVGAEAASSVYGAFLDSQLLTTNPISLSYFGGYLSTSREMGFTYGIMTEDTEILDEKFRASYMRLWRFNNDNEWRIAVEVLSPF